MSANLTETLQPAYIDVPASVKFVSVDACNVFTLAVARSGDVYCFGCAGIGRQPWCSSWCRPLRSCICSTRPSGNTV